MKTALVTGSSQGIGLAIAELLSEKGYKVFLTGRNVIRLEEQANRIKALGFFAVDLAQPGSVSLLKEEFLKFSPNLDLLVNNAGLYDWSPIERYADLSCQEREKLVLNRFRLNAMAPYELCAAFVPLMKAQKYGRIVNIGSISGIVGEANASLYAASKASLSGLTKALALELAEFGITVNQINPGWVKTNILDASLNEVEQEEELERIPTARWIEPLEIAEAVLYLSSGSARSITGQMLNICGGLSLG